MQLKRGWWRQNDGRYAFLVGEHERQWFGRDGAGDRVSDANSWSSTGQALLGKSDANLTDHYAGDGPEPVEPVQLCLGWWEKKNGTVRRIVAHNPGSKHPWRDNEGLAYTDSGELELRIDGGIWDFVKRRPDLDQPQPGAKDELEKLRECYTEAISTVGKKNKEIKQLEERASEWESAYRELKAKIEDLIE